MEDLNGEKSVGTFKNRKRKVKQSLEMKEQLREKVTNYM